MKKIILILTIIAFVVSNSHAQDEKTDFRDKLQFGLKMGLNYSDIYDIKGSEYSADPKFGFVTGTFVTIPINKIIGIQPEILFSQKGFKATGSVLGVSYRYTRITNFIDAPILFALKPSGLLTLLAGPQYSYLINQKDVFENTTHEQEFNNDNMRKNMLCFLMGVDINLNHLVIGSRVGWDITNNNGDGTSTVPRYKNVWFQGTLGYRFY